MKIFFPLTLAALLASPLGISLAQAQPDVQNAPKADNPTNRPARPNLQNLAGMAPAERMQALLRRQFTAMGVTLPATQDALLLYVSGETTARQTLLEKARQLQMALRGNVMTDAQITTQLNDYLAAIDEDKTRRQTAYDTLNKTVDVTKSPKIEALLTLMGLANNAPNLMGGAMAGRGGMGGAMGGRGGQGTQNGGFGGGANGANAAAGAPGAAGLARGLNRRRQNGGAAPDAPAAPIAPVAGAQV